MAPATSSILSTHSGHCRIFIGPVVQKSSLSNSQTSSISHTFYQSQNQGQGQKQGPRKHAQHRRSSRSQQSHHNNNSLAPKPWWEQGPSANRSQISLHHLSTAPSSSSQQHRYQQPHSLSTANGFRNGNTSLFPGQVNQTAIPTLSYTFSDDSTTDSDESLCGPDDEDGGVTYANDSETDEGSHGEQQDHDDNDDEYDSEEAIRSPRYIPSSSESLSAPVGHSNNRHQQSPQSRIQEDKFTTQKVKGKGRTKMDDEDKNAAAELEANALARKLGKEKKRAKSMRDEGEPNRFKKLMGKHRERKRNQGRIEDPDVAWDQEGGFRNSRGRRMTSGALTVGHHHHHHQGHNPQQEHHSVLVSSPMSSEVDIPGTSHDRPVFVSSPMSSTMDIYTMERLERPNPTPIQHMTSNSTTDEARSGSGSGSGEQHLRPGIWNSPPSSSVSTSASSPMNSKPQRGSTWMTAREYAPSIGHESISRLTIQEESEPEDEEDDDADRFTLAKGFKPENEHEAADSGAGVHGATKGQGSSRVGNGLHDRTVNELAVSDQPPPKEPLSTTISKSSTRFGRVLLNKTPTGLKRPAEEEPATKSKLLPQPSICSINKECQKSNESNNKHDGKVKKHVRFLTKVQNASSRQFTIPSIHPAIKQDRMLVRKEVTERPGPHVFNSDTARRMERQSQGWAEWWCVLRGPTVGAHSHKHRLRRRSKKNKSRVEKGRLEFYYNHKKIKNSIILSSCTNVSIYSSLDYSIAVTQNFPGEIGLTIFIIRPRTISLACAWYMEIYTLLNGAAPIPSFIEIAVPDFDVKIRVPIPEDSGSEAEDEDDEDSMQDGSNEAANSDEIDEIRNVNGVDTSLSSTLPLHEVSNTGHGNVPMQMTKTSTSANATPFESFQTAKTSLSERMASKSFYLTTDDARPMLVAPDEVTPKLLRSHVLSLLKDVPSWMEVVKMWQDPTQHGDVALCWKRYDRIEWIYWTEHLLAETDNLHLKKEHIGFAGGSNWSGGMDETVVGPQVLDKTHLLELRPITHYPTKVRDIVSGEELFEPDPIEGYLVRVSTFAGNPIRRFRRLYLTSHDHMLIYTNPSQSHSPSMQHAGSIDPSVLLFCISPHQSTNPDHKDMAQSRSIRRLKAQVRAAQGMIDMTKIKSVRVLNVDEWNSARHLSYKKEKERERERENENEKLSKRERLGKAVKRAVEEAEQRHTKDMTANNEQEQPKVILREPDNYFFPTVITEPLQENTQHTEEAQGSSSSPRQQQQKQHQKQPSENENDIELDASEPMNNTLLRTDPTSSESNQLKKGTFKQNLIKSATIVADLLLHNDGGVVDSRVKDSNVIEIEMKEGCCVRLRAYSAEAAHMWRDQLEKLAQYWTLRRHLDTKEHMAVAKANHQLASSLDDDEIQVGETINEWDNNRASCSPQIWNWCVVNGCRSITKSGIMYMKPNVRSTFRKMFVVLTEGYLLFFHPHRRSKASGQVIPSSANKLYSIHSLTDIYIYSGHFADEDITHGTNDEAERLPRYYPDGLIVDDPDEDCTLSIWRAQRRRMFSRRGAAAMTTMSSRSLDGKSRIFGKDGLLSGIVKDGVVYGGKPQSCTVLRARSRPDLEEWVYAINMEVERCVRSERRRVRFRGHQ